MTHAVTSCHHCGASVTRQVQVCFTCGALRPGTAGRLVSASYLAMAVLTAAAVVVGLLLLLRPIGI